MANKYDPLTRSEDLTLYTATNVEQLTKLKNMKGFLVLITVRSSTRGCNEFGVKHRLQCKCDCGNVHFKL